MYIIVSQNTLSERHRDCLLYDDIIKTQREEGERERDRQRERLKTKPGDRQGQRECVCGSIQRGVCAYKGD